MSVRHVELSPADIAANERRLQEFQQRAGWLMEYGSSDEWHAKLAARVAELERRVTELERK